MKPEAPAESRRPESVATPKLKISKEILDRLERLSGEPRTEKDRGWYGPNE